MKILFVNFNIGSTVGINNGLAILSAVLKQERHKVDLINLSEDLDYPFDLGRMRNDITAFKPDVIGISLMEPQFKYVKTFCKDIRSYYSGILICGGPFPTMDPKSVLSVGAVNAVCIGEGEDAICELVACLENGKDYCRIKNLWV